MFEFDEFRFDPQEAVLKRGASTVELPPKALDVLAVLVRNAGTVVRKDDLLSLVWPGSIVEEGNLAVHVSTLRKVLARHGAAGGYIETLPKRGYRFTARVRRIPNGEPAVGESVGTLIRVAQHLIEQNTAAGCRRAVEVFDRCVKADPLNAEVRAKVADSLVLQVVRRDVNFDDAVGRARALLAQARKLRSDCAHVELAYSRLHWVCDWRWQQAIECAARAREVAHDTDTRLHAMSWEGIYAARIGNVQRGAELLEHACASLPLFPFSYCFLVEAYFLARDFTRAAAVCSQALELHPNTWYLHTTFARVLTSLGEYPAALTHLRLATLLCPEERDTAAIEAHLHASAGRTDRASAVVQRKLMNGRAPKCSRLSMAMVMAALGDKQAALEQIELACNERQHLGKLKMDCHLDLLRSEPRFRRVLSDVGM